jgi:hypothetical protein
MATFKKKDLNELVGGDFSSAGGDRNVTNNSEIETGPVQKPYNDTSDYEKGTPTTSDKVFGRYRQNIPWFAVYSFGGTRTGRGLATQVGVGENKTVMKKNAVEEKIEDLVKKSKDSDVTEKGYNPKVSKLIDTIEDCDLTDQQLDALSKAILNKKNNQSSTKKL